MLFRHTLTWRDVGFRERLTVIASIAGSTATVDLMRLLSNAALTTASDGPTVATGAAAPTEATYPDLSDTWVVTGEDSGTHRTQLYIPAPLVAAAVADGVNYSPATSQWIALEAALPALVIPYTGVSIQQIDAATIARNLEQASQPWFNLDVTHTLARRTLQWYGTHGRARLTTLLGDHASLGADFDTVMMTFQAVSAAVVTHYWEDDCAVYTDPPTTDLYNSVNDACNVYFQDADGNIAEVMIPAPDLAIFLPDGKTLNVAQVNVADFISSAIAQLAVPISGQRVTACLGGHLSKRSVY
jgi:hypothetical protein